MARLAGFWKKVAEGWTVQRIAVILIVVGAAVSIVGAINQTCKCTGWRDLGNAVNHIIGDFYANVSVDCLSIAFAILVIDRLNERRAEEDLKAQLIREMGSPDNGIALRAIKELRARGWIEDGSLRNARLSLANLEGAELEDVDLSGASLCETNMQRADLKSANLKGANLARANLQNAVLTNANLQDSSLSGALLRSANLSASNLHDARFTTRIDDETERFQLYLQSLENQLFFATAEMHKAVMPNGKFYEGRYCLHHDLVRARWVDCDPDSHSDMARFYGVSVEEYLAGQEWAREHLADLRREAGLDPDTGLPMEPTNDTEPQPANGTEPQPPARRNGHRHKASMVAHRGRW